MPPCPLSLLPCLGLAGRGLLGGVRVALLGATPTVRNVGRKIIICECERASALLLKPQVVLVKSSLFNKVWEGLSISVVSVGGVGGGRGQAWSRDQGLTGAI